MKRYYTDIDGVRLSDTWRVMVDNPAQVFFAADPICQEISERGTVAREAIYRFLEHRADIEIVHGFPVKLNGALEGEI